MPGEYTRNSKPTLRTNARFLSGFPIESLTGQRQDDTSNGKSYNYDGIKI